MRGWTPAAASAGPRYCPMKVAWSSDVMTMLGYGGAVAGSFWTVRLSIGTPSAWYAWMNFTKYDAYVAKASGRRFPPSVIVLVVFIHAGALQGVPITRIAGLTASAARKAGRIDGRS